MIDDPELRALFKAESEEHLQTLENGLLRLEAEPHDSAMLEELFRSAHSLKGAARMLGVEGVETLAHHFEDQLGAARRGHLVMSAATADRLYQGLDAMRRLAREAADGEAAQVDIPLVLAQLRGEILPAAPAPEDSPAVADLAPREDVGIPDAHSIAGSLPGVSVSELTPAGGSVAPDRLSLTPPNEDVTTSQEPERAIPTPEPSGIVPVAVPMRSPAQEEPRAGATVAAEEAPILVSEPPTAVDETQAAVSPAAFKIETIRVEPQKLDALMTLAGEMAVTTTRLARALAVIPDLTALWEEWGREATAGRTLPDSLPDGARDSLREQRTRFQERETGRLERMGQLLGLLERRSDAGITRMGLVSDALDEAIRNMRLLPISTIFNLFPRLVRDLSREQEKEVQFVVEGGAITADKHLLEEMKDPLMHMLRNAVDHGIEPPDERERHGKPRTATLTLRAYQTATNVVIEIADDGRGLDETAIRSAALHKRLRSPAEIAALSPEEVQMLIFAPGFSTTPLITNVSGRGVGLDVVRTNIERLKGTISVESVPGRGCTFRLQAPITLATTRVLLVQVARRSYALPLEAVQETSLVSPQAVFSIEGRPTIRLDSRPISTARLADLLALPSTSTASPAGKENQAPGSPEGSLLPCVLLAVGAERLGLFVDALLDEQEVILKPFGGLLQRVRNVFGATILNTGEICMVLNPQDLIESAKKGRSVRGEVRPSEEAARKKLLLLAEDSITTRTQEKRILESAGYEVVTAVDGADAFTKLGTRPFDAVISDVEMPNMDGLTLAARIRQDAKYKELPIILVTSLASAEDRQRGIEVGANAYITKSTFEQTVLLEALRRLV